MKKIIKSKIVIGLVFGLLMFACKPEHDKYEPNFIDPDLEVTVASLLEKGFNKVDSLSIAGKSFGRESVVYTFLNDRGPVFSKTVIVSDVSDSTSVVRWIESNRGIICSDWDLLDSTSKQFFIKGKNSGLILSGVYKMSKLYIYFDYPDVGVQIRSVNRTITEDGKTIIEGVDNSGIKTVLERNFLGLF